MPKLPPARQTARIPLRGDRPGREPFRRPGLLLPDGFMVVREATFRFLTRQVDQLQRFLISERRVTCRRPEMCCLYRLDAIKDESLVEEP